MAEGWGGNTLETSGMCTAQESKLIDDTRMLSKPLKEAGIDISNQASDI